MMNPFVMQVLVHVKCTGFRVTIYPAIRHGNLSRILWQCQFIFIFKDFAIFDMPACEAKVFKTLDIYNVLLKQKTPIDWYIIGAQV